MSTQARDHDETGAGPGATAVAGAGAAAGAADHAGAAQTPGGATTGAAATTAAEAVGGFSRLVTVTRTGSTNDDLHRDLTGPDGALDPVRAGAWPHLSALRALSQSAGRGRAGRSWITPERGALTVSVVLRPLVAPAALGWLPLLGGLAVRDALTGILASAGSSWRVGTKWPNDVVLLPPHDARLRPVEGWGSARKVAGVLSEAIMPAHPRPGAARDRDEACAVVLGIGINVARPVEGMPVAWAACLEDAGCPHSVEQVMEAVSVILARDIAEWEALGGDPDAGRGGLGRRLRAACLTLGHQVRADTPQGPCTGVATDVSPGLVLRAQDGSHRVLLAGDVTHVRFVGSTH